MKLSVAYKSKLCTIGSIFPEVTGIWIWPELVSTWRGQGARVNVFFSKVRTSYSKCFNYSLLWKRSFSKCLKSNQENKKLQCPGLEGASIQSVQGPDTFCHVWWPSVCIAPLPEHNLRGGSLVTLRVTTIGQNSLVIHAVHSGMFVKEP